MKKNILILSAVILSLQFINCERMDKLLGEYIDMGMSDNIYSQTVGYSLTGVGEFNLDINQDLLDDYKFEIVNLKDHNNRDFDYEDTLAARVISLNNNKVLDNSTYGYLDALNKGDEIEGQWGNFGVLGTIEDAGQFEGNGEKYLGIQLKGDDAHFYGYIKLKCSSFSDTLSIIEFAYNMEPGRTLLAGEK